MQEAYKIDSQQNSLMWEMFDDDIECDECGGPGPPPKFLIPPPPRPPFMQELSKCPEDETYSWDNSDNMCEAIPILDASYHSSPSLQTSAMIAVFSLLLVLVILISSLFVWKHKRKVQNFLPCKTPTRGGHLSGGVTGAHSVTYEDPDAHLGHRPLVMRHHRNVEMIHPKSIHYPSGYPMTRSPPLFVCSSPGPDPYRSNDNVYEELGPGRDSDNESEPPMHSDDDFAEDELSLPGERSFIKSSPDTAAPVATIYHERINGTSGQERNSLLSSSSSTTNNENKGGILSGVLRQATGCGFSMGRKSHHNNSSNSSSNNKSSAARKIGTYSVDELNTSSDQTGSDIVPTVYDDRNLMSLAYNSCSNSNNNNTFSSSGANNQYPPPSVGVALTDNEVERRNRINNQLHHPPPVSTIFRERINYPSRLPQPYYTQHSLLNVAQQRSRTNPRSLDRRRIGIPIDHEPSYGYAEPVFHEGLLYDACLAHPNSNSLRTHPYPFIMPEYTPFRTLASAGHHHHLQQTPKNLISLPAPPPQPPQQIYSRDSSFGSDSGYSHITQTSSGRSGGCEGLSSSTSATSTGLTRPPNDGLGNGYPNKLGLSFSWNRRSGKTTPAAAGNNNQNLPSSNNNNNAGTSNGSSNMAANSTFENS